MLARLSPPALLILSFLAAILAGTALLLLPQASADGRSVPVVDALFTATSAVCVTGLTTVDTAAGWSPLGRAVLLVLIQLGGLGIMTFSTFFALLLGRRISLAQREVVASGITPLSRVDVLAVLRRILLFTAAAEAAGAVLLWLAWRSRFGELGAMRHAVFHAVSAFCNAGFSTFRDNLLGFRGEPLVTGTVLALVVAGGIGFVVVLDLENRIRYGARLSLHTRMVLSTTGILILGGAVLFWLFESGNVLSGLSAGEQFLASVFASITPRTAGFNTVDYGRLTVAGLFLTMVLMFVGGSPGSCAGGVKTSTILILLTAARTSMAGRQGASLFRRTVPELAVRQAQTLVLLSLIVLFATPFLLGITEHGPAPYREASARYLDLTFEAVSAFGTVGLSTGVTPALSGSGKLVLIVLMFVGRVGLLTVVMMVARTPGSRFRYAEEGVMVG